jgi:AraC-like DNA-binding protein
MTQDDVHFAHRVMHQTRPVIIGACMHGLPEESLLVAAGTGAADLAFHASRTSLLPFAHANRPCAVLFPLLDPTGMGCAPLITRFREELPEVPCYVLVMLERPARGLAEAVRAGGRLVLVHDVSETRVFLERLQVVRGLSAFEHEAATALTRGLAPSRMVEVLMFCIRRAHERLNVAAIAEAFRVSRRSLARQAHLAGWPAPVELIEWGRLIYASVLMWRQAATLVALAEASGFDNADALRRASRRRLGVSTSVPHDLSPLRVSAALRRRIGARND